MWDAIILAGKHALLPFELFQSLQRTYSWMKYYNSELDSRNSSRPLDEKVLRDLLEDVQRSIHRSLDKLNETKENKISSTNNAQSSMDKRTTINTLNPRAVARSIKILSMLTMLFYLSSIILSLNRFT